MQYLAGEMRVKAGDMLPLLATHNTVRLRFDVEAAEYLHLARPDAAFPAAHFSMLADTRRNQARTVLPAIHHHLGLHCHGQPTQSRPVSLYVCMGNTASIAHCWFCCAGVPGRHRACGDAH